MQRKVVLRLEEFETRDLPSQSGVGLLATLQPMAGTAIREAQQIASVSFQEVQQISSLALQEIQQLAQSILGEIQQLTDPAISTSQGAGPTQTSTPVSSGTRPAADQAAELHTDNPSQQAAATKSSSNVPSTTTKGRSGYIYYRYGNQSNPTTLPTPIPGLALEGGGTDINLLYQWMAARGDGVDATVSDNTLELPKHAMPQAGNFLVLGTTKDDSYDSYIYGLAQADGVPLNSVATLDIPSSQAANDPFVAQTIANASAIFIMGGDQSTYVNDWQNTPVQTALDQAAASGVPIGGTSAGTNVLGQYIYSAESTSGAVSSDVLANPYSSEISLDKNFLSVPGQVALPFMQNTITDPHFFERDRMGRTVTFLARLVEDPQWSPPSAPGGPTPLQGTMAIGIDQSTALLIDTAGPTRGAATVIGNSPTNHLYFLTTTGTLPALQPGTTNTLAAPLSWGTQSSPAVNVYRATVGDNFQFEQSTQTWKAITSSSLDDPYTLWVTNGTVDSSQPNGSIY
jgi:cyanophycinase-like exopeptidase